MTEDEAFEAWWKAWQAASWKRGADRNRRMPDIWERSSKPFMRDAWMARAALAAMMDQTPNKDYADRARSGDNVSNND